MFGMQALAHGKQSCFSFKKGGFVAMERCVQRVVYFRDAQYRKKRNIFYLGLYTESFNNFQSVGKSDARRFKTENTLLLNTCTW
jgi:hypothetical protein